MGYPLGEIFQPGPHYSRANKHLLLTGAPNAREHIFENIQYLTVFKMIALIILEKTNSVKCPYIYSWQNWEQRQFQNIYRETAYWQQSGRSVVLETCLKTTLKCLKGPKRNTGWGFDGRYRERANCLHFSSDPPHPLCKSYDGATMGKGLPGPQGL